MRTSTLNITCGVTAALIFGLIYAPSTVAGEISIVASAKSAAETMTKEQAAQVLLGKASAFSDGKKTILLDLPENSPTRSELLSKVTGKDQAQIKAHWSRIIFTGKGQAPKELPDANAVKKALADNPNAVGYIESNAVDPSVKVLFKIN